MGNGRICIWTDSTFAGSKTNKQTKRKRNSRRELQGRLNHCSKTFGYCRVDRTVHFSRLWILNISDKT
jgi:hypothetical protein